MNPGTPPIMRTYKSKYTRLMEHRTRLIQEASNFNPPHGETSATSITISILQSGTAYSDRLQSLPSELLHNIASHYISNEPVLEHHYSTRSKHHTKRMVDGEKPNFPKINRGSNTSDISKKIRNLKTTCSLWSHEHALINVSKRLREIYLDHARKFIRPVFRLTHLNVMSADIFENLIRSPCPFHAPILDVTTFSIEIDEAEIRDLNNMNHWTIKPLLKFIGGFTHAIDASVVVVDTFPALPQSLNSIRHTLMHNLQSLKFLRAGAIGSQEADLGYVKCADGEWRSKPSPPPPLTPEMLHKMHGIKWLMKKRQEARESELRRKAEE